MLAGCEHPSGSEATQSSPATLASAPRAAVHVPLKTGFVRLTDKIHPLARPELDVGRMDPDESIAHLSLFFKLSPEQRRDRDALVAAQLDPKSPSYRQWLTPEDYAARFGARPEDIARASAWLSAQGFEVYGTSRLGTRVTFSAKVSQLEAAFQTEMHRYHVGGEDHYAMATAPAFPESIASVVLALHNTHDFYKQPVSAKRNMAAFAHRDPRYTLPLDAGADAGPLDVLAPPDWAAAYDVARLYDPGIGGTKLDGTGVTIGIVGTAQVAQSDIDDFRTRFGLPPSTVEMTVVPNTGAPAAGRRGNGIEAILDLEWSGGVAKGAQVHYVYVGANDRNVDDATFYLIEENLASVMSESFGGCEAGELPSDADILEENGTAANLLGITYMAAAGDDGAADCGGASGQTAGLYVDEPGAFPGVTSVGGTQFPTPGWNDAGNLLAYPQNEQVWNESSDPYSMYGLGAGGGGVSCVFSQPSYQVGINRCVPIGALPFPSAGPMRQVPDVALSAASGTPGYFIECTGNSTGSDCAATGGDPVGIPIGGTSASSPSFAGVVAILNQAIGTRLGNINPALYALYADPPANAPFHDIVGGSNEIVCGAAAAGDAGSPPTGWQADAGCQATGEYAGLYGFPAEPGYDCATGLGSIDAYNLVSSLIGVVQTKTVLAVSPTQTTEGGKVTLDATITPATASTSPITGVVTFTFESFTTTGATDLSWELGSVLLSDGTAASAKATLVTAIPPGLVKPGQQYVDVVAVYGGDTKHLGSQSPKVGVGFANIDFAIDPPSATLDPSASKLFTTTGGFPPVQWFVDVDTTRGRTDAGAFGGAVFPGDGGLLTVGPKAGYVEISALDNDGAEVNAYITVGVPTTPAPWSADGGVYIDAAVPPVAPIADSGASRDASTADSGAKRDAGVAAKDAGRADAAQAVDAGPEALSTGDCRCEAPGVRARGIPPMGALGGALLALVALARRRRA
jgi:hypothetical protein